MIPHDVKRVVGFEPLFNGSYFTRNNFTVNIPGQETIDQRVQHDQESPHARIETMDDSWIDFLMTDLVNVAEINDLWIPTP